MDKTPSGGSNPLSPATCLALIADTSISGIRVARELDRLLEKCGKPKVIVSDNGTELTSNAILQWADDLVRERD